MVRSYIVVIFSLKVNHGLNHEAAQVVNLRLKIYSKKIRKMWNLKIVCVSTNSILKSHNELVYELQI